MHCLLRNNKGVALVTALMLTMISLTIVMAVLYMVTQGIKSSGQLRLYRTSLEASYGGSEILIKDVLPLMMQNFDSASLIGNVESEFSAITLEILTTQICLQNKLTSITSSWPTACSKIAKPKSDPDMTILLQANTGSPFKVYSKIVDTVIGNSDTSGLQLEGGGVAESSSLLTPQHFPYVYRVEIQAERETGASAQANLEVLYAY